MTVMLVMTKYKSVHWSFHTLFSTIFPFCSFNNVLDFLFISILAKEKQFQSHSFIMRFTLKQQEHSVKLGNVCSSMLLRLFFQMKTIPKS